MYYDYIKERASRCLHNPKVRELLERLERNRTRSLVILRIAIRSHHYQFSDLYPVTFEDTDSEHITGMKKLINFYGFSPEELCVEMKQAPEQ